MTDYKKELEKFPFGELLTPRERRATTAAANFLANGKRLEVITDVVSLKKKALELGVKYSRTHKKTVERINAVLENEVVFFINNNDIFYGKEK